MLSSFLVTLKGGRVSHFHSSNHLSFSGAVEPVSVAARRALNGVRTVCVRVCGEAGYRGVRVDSPAFFHHLLLGFEKAFTSFLGKLYFSRSFVLMKHRVKCLVFHLGVLSKIMKYFIVHCCFAGLGQAGKNG